MKSKSTAYILWFFLGFFGAHKFYLEKTGMGLLYFFTFGLFFIGWFIDLFTLGNQVDQYNLIWRMRFTNQNYNTNTNSIVVNVPEQSSSNGNSMYEQLNQLADLRDKGVITQEEFTSQKSKLLN